MVLIGRHDLERTIDEFFGKEFSKSYDQITGRFSYDFEDKGDLYAFELALPGFTKSDLNITFEDKVLTISYETDKPTAWKKSFKRKFSTPKDVDSNEIKASLEHGILKVDLPKLKDKRPISVQIL